ncbi:aldo/keto reductase [Streptomyces sp. NPDC057496]|uniref:aldo/keto reductase n=1 Tax=Streptomyces sp. NPDC057496 TaxID=3346149 RepID=UPI0036B3A823
MASTPTPATTRVRLGSTPLEVTRLGLGTASIGGLYRPVGDRVAFATVNRAWERGIRFFDTAPLYGYGLAERRSGAALVGRPREDYVLSTKVGLLLEPGGPDVQDGWPEGDLTGLSPRFDFSYRGTHRSFEHSLERLGVDRIDLLHIHDADRHYDRANSGARTALAELRDRGTIGAIGVGLTQAPLLARFIRETGTAPLDCVMLGGRYTLLDQSGLDELLPLCEDRGIGVLAAGVFNSGLLAAPSPRSHYDYEPPTPDMLARARAIESVCRRHGVPLRAAAAQFPLGHPSIASVVVGARTPEQVDDAVDLFDRLLPGALWSDLKHSGLLPAHVPVPAEW